MQFREGVVIAFALPTAPKLDRRHPGAIYAGFSEEVQRFVRALFLHGQ
jgi:hypothetical protein